MKRMITAALTAAALAATPGTQAAEMTPKQVARIAKQVVRQMRALEPAPVGDNTSPVEHALTADHATTAGHAVSADDAATAGHAATADSARTAETAEVAGIAENCIAENANPMAYAVVHRTGRIEQWSSFRISQADVFLEPESGTYCFAGPRPRAIQVTLDFDETTRPPQPGETFPAPPPGSWNSNGYQPTPPAPPGQLYNPMVTAGLGQGLDCPAGTKFYVRGSSAMDGTRGYAAFFLSLVL